MFGSGRQPRASRSLGEVSDFAIYVSTMRSDYRLAKALVSSLEAFIDRPPIVVVPDDDFRGESMFGYPIWRPGDGRVAELVGYYKKLRIFWGPARRFVHFDADQLALRDPSPWLADVMSRQAPFFVANRKLGAWAEWDSGDEPTRARIFTARVGDIPLLSAFDREFDWRVRYPLNSGEFAASRDVIDPDLFLSTFRQARTYHLSCIGRDDMCFSRAGPFMSDQGFLHYFLARHCPQSSFEWVDDLFRSGASVDGQLGSSPLPWSGTMVHWAGCARPGPVPVRGRIPYAREWRRRYFEYCRSRGDWSGACLDSGQYLLSTSRDLASAAKKALRRSVGAGAASPERLLA
jgi:hypothetical protein